jgi:uncharacterized protein (PEP-CTERM system associated)
MLEMIVNKLNHLIDKRIVGGSSLVYASLVGGMGLSLSSGNLHGADWIISPSVGLQQVYTDNAGLNPENVPEGIGIEEVQSDNITVLRPTLSILKEGARASLDFNYAPEYRRYSEETQDDEVVHFLRTQGNLEIAENHLFLDGWLRADRTNVTSRGRSGIGGLTGTDDDTDYYSVGLSPYFTARLGDFSVVEVRFTKDKVNYSASSDNTNANTPDSTGERGEIAFGSGSMFTNQIWEVLYQQSDVEYEFDDDDGRNNDDESNNETKMLRAELIQKLTTQWALAFSAGYEEYDLAVTDDRDDSTWSVGAIYTPTPRTRIALGAGERSFGDDYYFDFSHRASRTIWTASYEQDFISARDELDSRPLFERQDAFGNLVRDPILEASPVTSRAAYSPSITEDYYESKRFTTEFTYQTERTGITLRGRHLERSYDHSEGEVDRNTKDIELSILLQRRLGQLTNGYFQISGADHDEENLIYDQLTATLGLSYQFGTDSNVGFSIAHMERDAEEDENGLDLNSYEENHASLNVTMGF